MPEPDLKLLFALEEYKSLRGEIDIRIREAFSLIIYCVTAVSAVYGLFLSVTMGKQAVPDHQTLVNWTAYIATLFPVLGWVKASESWANVLRIAGYLRKLEDQFGVFGWEHETADFRDGLDFPALSQPPYHIFWGCLLLATFFVDVLVFNARI